MSCTSWNESWLQPLLSPQFPLLLPHQFEFFPPSCDEKAVDLGSRMKGVYAGLTQPAGQTDGGKAQPLGNDSVGEVILQAELNDILIAQRRESASGL